MSKTPKRKTRLDAELERRAHMIDPNGDICQDDYEWATLTGEYEWERQFFQGYVEPEDEQEDQEDDDDE